MQIMTRIWQCICSLSLFKENSMVPSYVSVSPIQSSFEETVFDKFWDLSPRVTGTSLIERGRMKDWVDHQLPHEGIVINS